MLKPVILKEEDSTLGGAGPTEESPCNGSEDKFLTSPRFDHADRARKVGRSI